MSTTTRARWYYPWVPLGMLTVLGALIGALVFLAPSGNQVKAAPISSEAAAFQTTDKLLITVNLKNPQGKLLQGTLRVELLDPEGKEVASTERSITQQESTESHRFEFAQPKLAADRLKVRCRFGDHNAETPLAKVLLIKAHETTLSAGQELHPGSIASLRCEVHGVKSMTENIPLPDSRIEVRLRSDDGKLLRELYTGKAGADGKATVRFRVPPDLKTGSYKLEVATTSNFGHEQLAREIRVKSQPKVLLVTDKPLYQPGQVIHIRALSLAAFNLTPAQGKFLTFEVEDSKGNKVFKKEQKTSDYGICAVDFQLADEVNTGDYQIRAILGEHQASKTVTVKQYVLPKFKTTITTDKKYYLPKEIIKAELQSDYLFGKHVANSKVKVTASTFDVAFKEFQTWEGKTDENGHVKFEIPLPDYFVGQPLEKGNALVRLEAKLTDTADHSETISRTYPVSTQAIRVSLIPEAGRLIPGVENRVFVAAIYPDGSPARCDLNLWFASRRQDKPLATTKTNDAGLAEIMITPKPEQFRIGEWENRNVEMVGGKTVTVGGQKSLLDLYVVATDSKGNKAEATSALNSEPFGENVLLRLDRAIYKGGDTMNVEVRSSAGLPSVYVDVIRDGQTMLTTSLDVKQGKATQKLALPPEVFGTLEVHAYQMLLSGEIIRDSRIVYAQPTEDLRIKVEAEKEYRPGQDGVIRFQVTDQAGKPTQAALGVLIVDEAVYALQDMQPGLEKVYFTLQEELLKPRAQAVYQPRETIDTLVREPELPANQQQIAQVLMTAVQPKMPALWEVNPALDRRRQMDQQLAQIAMTLWNHVNSGDHPFLEKDKNSGEWHFKTGLFEEVFKTDAQKKLLSDPLGGRLSPESLARLDREFTANRLGAALTTYRMQQLVWPIIAYTQQHQKEFYSNNQWTFPEDVVAKVVKTQGLSALLARDAWGNNIKLIKRDKKLNNPWGNPQFDHHELLSAGPDGKLGTDDDVLLTTLQGWWNQTSSRWTASRMLGVPGEALDLRFRNQMLEQKQMNGFFGRPVGGVMPPGLPGGFGGGFGGGGFPGAQGGPPMAVPTTAATGALPPAAPGGPVLTSGAEGGATAPAPVRVREFFPETMLWQPSLITDEKGHAQLPITFADSITTWRLTASASSRGGLLGGTTAPLRVFQPFFVDLDLPLNLTQNDEVTFPVAVYNYLDTPQRITLELEEQKGAFELIDGQGYRRALDLKKGEVAGVKYRIKATRIGSLLLSVKATGSRMSDAVKRTIEVVPDGKPVEQVVSDYLQGNVTQTLAFPENAIPDASRLMVKVYPGVFSQLLEGTEGMLRLPNGCFEQTSSSAYPNILVMDYLKKTNTITPKTRMTAEHYLNIGYQRLLTFERPGGGFDWWGSGPPLIWLSAYGLQEFNDMSKVWPVDPGVITRTQAWLMKQRDPDGTWSKIGATHGESIERMGDPKLLLTSYVVWALIDSGMKGKDGAPLEKSIAYIREHLKTTENAYILALAANALASWDPKHESTQEVLQKLEAQKKKLPEWKACVFPAVGQSLSYARDDSLQVETTALTALAMMKTGQFTTSVNEALMYLVKSKGAHGTWGTTQATILALKALITGAGARTQEQNARFTITVNGKKAVSGEVTQQNSDVLQQFDLKEFMQPGRNEVNIVTDDKTTMMYQIVGRHYVPWKTESTEKPILDVGVEYDRTKLATSDLLKAKATLRYNGKQPTYQVIVDLGIPPGFTVDPGDFAEMVGAKAIQRFSITARQVTLYIGDVVPGDVKTFDYTLKPKYPLKAKTPQTVAYEYYTPKNRATTKPVELTVVEKK